MLRLENYLGISFALLPPCHPGFVGRHRFKAMVGCEYTEQFKCIIF
jgi:hypothetical protein